MTQVRRRKQSISKAVNRGTLFVENKSSILFAISKESEILPKQYNLGRHLGCEQPATNHIINCSLLSSAMNAQQNISET
jgi:hypothetical protein